MAPCTFLDAKQGGKSKSCKPINTPKKKKNPNNKKKKKSVEVGSTNEQIINGQPNKGATTWHTQSHGHPSAH